MLIAIHSELKQGSFLATGGLINVTILEAMLKKSSGKIT